MTQIATTKYDCKREVPAVDNASVERDDATAEVVANTKNKVGAKRVTTPNFDSEEEEDDKVVGADHTPGGGERQGSQRRSRTIKLAATTPTLLRTNHGGWTIK